MPDLTRQERIALLVVGCLLLAAAAVRVLQPAPDEAHWDGSAEAPRAEVGPPIEGAEEAAARTARASLPLADDERIAIDTADETELTRLPRIGPALAGRIVAWRDERGGIAAVEELLEVPGIGPTVFAGLQEHVTVAGGGGTRPRARETGEPDGRAELIDLNRAGVRELQELPGIGPALARGIVEHRDSAGPFRSADELQQVSGIGPASVQRLAPLVTTAAP